MNFRYFLFALILVFPLCSYAAPVKTDEVEAELIAENQGFRPGGFDNWIALRLRPEPGWHVYWQNPGDSGIPTSIDWDLPAGASAGDMLWPYPHQEALGELTNYGYSEETLHLIPIRVAEAGAYTLKGTAKWLVCKDICIPGQADLQLDVTAGSGPLEPDLAWVGAFNKARKQLPLAAPDWDAQYAISGGDFSLMVEGAQFPAEARIEFFPLANDLVSHAAEQRIVVDASNGLRLSQALSTYFEEPPQPVTGVLVIHDTDKVRSFQIRAEPGAVTPVPASTAAPKDQAQVGPMPSGPAEAAAQSADPTLLVMLGFAVIGGLILNLMPCVFPVLAIKALSVMSARSEPATRRQAHALAYTLGVILSFMVVAGLLIALRAGGQALGWGFQLQSPAFVFALTVVLFAMGLSLSGAAHFGSRWMGAGERLASRSGLSGSFFTGALAVVVATPCSAPFMASALGFALTQSAAIALMIFAALGLGLALPFLLIGFVPRLASMLPKPGAWMETFKQLMAFPLYLTAVWLLWVLGGLTSRDGMALALIGLVLVAVAVWSFGRARSGVGQGFAIVALVAAFSLMLHPAMHAQKSEKTVSLKHGSEVFSQARFDALRAEGRSVFVDFTADWCLTCKINERGAMRADSVRDAFRRNDVVTLVGDWTRADPAITAVLDRYGRSGVPLYLASRDGAEPVVLPQILTPDIIIGAFE